MSRKRFYQDCYLKTGWLPMQPLAQRLAVGDACQLRQGRFQPLLNIADAHLIERIGVSQPVVLDPVDWRLSGDVQQTFSETLWAEDDEGERRAFTKQVLEFNQAGGYLFSAAQVSASLMTNWSQIRDEVTLKLTQLHYGFTDVYVVTGVARANDWALAVSGRAGGRLDVSASSGNSDHHVLLGHASARVEQRHGSVDFEQSEGRPAHFFRAKKLVISDAMHDHYLKQLLENTADLRPGEIANWLNASLLNLVKSNELNLTTSINFFAWADLSLDDIERLTA
ncbi:hypothetical protein RYB01_03430 [Pseudomonas syringae]|nr:hypothetical protein [Pseudomonas syringae]